MPIAALAAATDVAQGVGGIAPSSGASGGVAESGGNVIAVGVPQINLGAIVNAVRGGGSTRVGGNNIREANNLQTRLEQPAVGFNIDALGSNASFNVSPLLIGAAFVGVLILPRLLR